MITSITSVFDREAKTGQSKRSSTIARSHYLPLIIAGIVLWLGCFHGLNVAGIFDRDEGLYATASRQMLESGDWIVPRTGPEIRFAKPPLIYWFQAPAIYLLGATPLAARLPSALATALTALALWWWARRRGASRIGWLAAMIYVLCPLAMGLARQAIIDSLLTFCLTLTVIGWIEGYRGDRRWYLLMAAGAGFSTLAKSALGLALPVAAFVLWLILRRDLAEVRRVPWLAAAALYLLIALPWHLAMWHITGNTFIKEYFLSNQVQRFKGEAWGHVQPIWFYVPILLGGMFPWSVFVPISWLHRLRNLRQFDRQELDCAWGMWALWALVVVGFFSISRSKLPGYVLPALPALSLLVAVRLESLWATRRGPSTGEAVLLGVVGVLVGAIGLGIGTVGSQWRSQPPAVFWGKTVTPKVTELVTLLTPLMLAMGVLFLLGSAIILMRWRVIPHVICAALLMGSTLILLLTHLGLPRWSGYNITPLHDLGRRALPALEHGDPLVIYALKPTRTSLRYVVGHTPQVTETDKPETLQQIMQTAGRGYVLTARDTQLPALSCPVREEAAARQWVLWRCQP